MDIQNRGMKICLVGAGRWGNNHLNTLKKLSVLAGVVEQDSSRLGKIRESHSNLLTFNNLSQALPCNFDGYVIATPAETHYQIASQILETGKPCLVEKPLALRSTEARHLTEIAGKKKVPLMVGHLLLFHPAFKRIKEILNEGKIGKLQYLYSNRLNLGTVRTQENILWSFAPHDVAIFQYLVGSRPMEVISRGGAFIQNHIHDSSLTILRYPGNIVGHIFVNWLHPFKEHRLVVIGSKGMLSYDDSSKQKELKLYEKGVDFVRGEPVSRDGPTEVIDYESTPPLEAEISEFLTRIRDCAHDHQDGIASGKSAVEVLEILERATEGLLAEPNQVPDPARSELPEGAFVHPSSYLDEGASIGAYTKVWHFSHIQKGAVIGKNCSIGQNVNVAENVRIGSHVKIQNNVSVYEGVELEDYVFCGPSMVFTNVHVPRSKYPQRGSKHYQKTLVREGASIGANATIICGITIGCHAFIGAGAVVTKDVPDYAVMIGNPARRVGWMCECGGGLFEDKEHFNCKRCGRVISMDPKNQTLGAKQ
ncbi:MAG: Gfo/Idh/MocA family oxidoreductase [Bdellovibrionota bacterium]|nr:MAG: Gfo/Idh/MocA family oxidoreductase [Bdellovibrionota bacterium]